MVKKPIFGKPVKNIQGFKIRPSLKVKGQMTSYGIFAGKTLIQGGFKTPTEAIEAAAKTFEQRVKPKIRENNNKEIQYLETLFMRAGNTKDKDALKICRNAGFTGNRQTMKSQIKAKIKSLKS